MRKLLSFAAILILAVVSGACVNTFAVHELNQIAAQYIEDGDYPAAISRLESSIDLDGAVYESRYNLAVAYLRVGDCQKAFTQIKEAEKLIKEEPAVFYTLGVASNCLADNIYKKKTPDGLEEEIVYNNPEEAYKMAVKYVDYLTQANDAFDKYSSLVPTAEDVNEVISLVNQNKQKISEKKAQFNLE